MPNSCHDSRGITFADTVSIFSEYNILAPMQFVLYTPMTAYSSSKNFGISRNGSDEITLFNRQLAILVKFSFYLPILDKPFYNSILGKVDKSSVIQIAPNLYAPMVFIGFFVITVLNALKVGVVRNFKKSSVAS